MQGIEFRQRCIHIVSVEPNLQSDSAVLVDAEHLENFVPGCARALIDRAQDDPCKCETLASYGKNDMLRPHDPVLEIAPRLVHHVVW